MRESLTPANAPVRSVTYRAQQASRMQSYSVYKKKQIRQRRLTVLVLALMVLVGLVGATGWGLYHAARFWVAPVILGPEKTGDFEALLEKDFGPSLTPSLLYDNNFNSLVLSHNTFVASPGNLQPILPTREDTVLHGKLAALFAEYPASRFTPHLYLYNPQDNTYVSINGFDAVPAASIIKLPILMDYLLHLDEGDIATNTPLLYADFHRASGSGILQYSLSSTEYKANDIAAQMIRISDNTCTNMMINYLGGTDMVNRRLEEMGLRQTRIRNWLPDLTGTNTVSPYEMSTILYNINFGRMITNAARQNGIQILESTHNKRLIVDPLPKTVRVAHKTGDIGRAIGDTGIVYMPDGRQYILAAQVERPFNDYTARDMIQRASKLVYDYIEAQPFKPKSPLNDLLPTPKLSQGAQTPISLPRS